MPKPHPPAFRRQALDLLTSGRRMWDVAASLGISDTCLHRWKVADWKARGLIPGADDEKPEALAVARKRIPDLEQEVKILRRPAAAVEEAVPPKGRYRRVAELADDGVPVNRDCRELGGSTSGYYEWKSRERSWRATRHARLTDLITASHRISRRLRSSEGACRVGARSGHHCHNTVFLLMRRACLHGLPTSRRRGKPTKPPAVFDDLVKRVFRRVRPNDLWVTDITERPKR